MTPAALPIQLSPPAPRAVGVCRVCGCTDQEGCVLEARPLITCSWIDEDLCSRCHGPERPTAAQRAEIARIESRHGRVTVRRGPLEGELDVALTAGFDPRFYRRPTVLTLAPSGRVVGRIGRTTYDNPGGGVL